MMLSVEVTFDSSGGYEIIHQGVAIGRNGVPLPPPPAVFLGSVGACAGLFALNYLKARGLPFEGLRVTAEANHADNPRRLAVIRLSVALPTVLEERHLVPLRRTVDLCTLKNTLAHPPVILTELTSAWRVA